MECRMDCVGQDPPAGELCGAMLAHCLIRKDELSGGGPVPGAHYPEFITSDEADLPWLRMIHRKPAARRGRSMRWRLHEHETSDL